jgi:AraC-like DNA-binding protein
MGEFFHNLKMKEAATLLRETNLPIKEISFRVSYNDTAHFYRAFSNTYKTTPAKYRKKFVVRG